MRSTTRHKSLERSLDFTWICFALKPRSHNSLAIDEEGQGQAQHPSVAFSERSVPQGDWIINAQRIHQLANRARVVVHRDTDYFQPAWRILLLPAAKDGHFDLARRTPSSPEVEEHNLTFELSRIDTLTSEIVADEMWRLAIDK